MSSFDERLEKAIGRGQCTGRAQAEAEAERALSEQELRRLHTQYRLQVSEHIEACLRKLADHFLGFRFETVVSERGWGAAIVRDDVGVGARSGRPRASFFSRLEMVIRPLSEYYVLDLTAKAAIRNRELFTRSYYQRLAEVDLQSFTELVDLWCLEYAEQYAAKA